MEELTPFSLLLSITALSVWSAQALPLPLDPPIPILGNLDRDGTLLVSDDLRAADFGGGLFLPVRWVYRSSDQSANAYGWAGFKLTVLEARAIKKTSLLYEITMLNGDVEYFSKGTGDQSEVWTNNNKDWTGVEEDNKFTITRWDGWEMEFRDGLIYRLKTDDNRTLRWEYDSTDATLVTRVYEPATNTTVISVGLSSENLHMYGSSTLRGAHTLTVNGDTYTFKYYGGTLKDIEFPDGRKTQWKFQSFETNAKRLTLTQEGGWWRSWEFGAEDRLVQTDDYWDYTIIGGKPTEDGVVYNRPTMQRTRVATGEKEIREYSAANSILKKKDVLENEVTSYRYTTPGKLYNKLYKTEWKKAGGTAAAVFWRGVYNAETGDLISSFDALDNQTTYSYERFAGANEFQAPKKIILTDPMGRTRSVERDEQGNVIEVISAAGVKRKMEYDSRRRLTRVKNASNEVLSRFVYGDKDQILERYDALGNKTTFEYTNYLGNPLLTKATTPGGRVAEITYDSKGRAIKTKSPTGAEWDLTYLDDWSVVESITDPLNSETSYEYDARLNRIKITDPLNRITQTVYDDLDLPVEVTDALGQKITMENNGNGDTKKLTDARQNIYTASWDGSGIRKSLTWPDASKQTRHFNANGDLTQWKARGQIAVVNFTLNTSREVVGWDWSNGAESGTAALTLNAFGQLTAASTTTMGLTVAQNFSYDGEGRLAAMGQVVGNVTRNASVTYNVNGQIASLTYPAGFVVAYEYNADSQLTCIKKNGVAVASYAYDTGGRLSTRTFSSGVVTTYSYDSGNRLASMVVTSGGSVLWAERYGYNAAGERIYTLQGASGTAGDGYWLDATSQLRGVKYGSTDATVSFASQNGASSTAEWEYDAVGNRLHENGTAGTTTYVTDVTNQYVSVSSVPTVSYSARGDMTQFGNWAYTYDAQGNLIRAHNSQSNTLAKYWRDAFGHRTVKDVDGSKTVFFNIGTTQFEAYNVTNATFESTIHEPGIDRPVAQVSASGTVTFYHQDCLGNVVLISDAGGAKVQRYTYDVWGKASGFDASGSSIPASAFASRFLFTAREYDVESGLYHYRARAYSPTIGRFLQTDPIDFGGRDVNMIRYVGNNPVNTVDPLGLWGINDCWTTPFPPHDALKIPNPNPPGTPGDFPPAGDGGGTRAWDHSPGGGGGGGGGGFDLMGMLFAVSDFSAGVGDALTFGMTNAMREAGGYNGVVDHNSGAYSSGQVTGVGLGLATAGAGVAANAAGIAASATAGTQAAELAGTYVIAAAIIGGREAAANPQAVANAVESMNKVGTQTGTAASIATRSLQWAWTGQKPNR